MTSTLTFSEDNHGWTSFWNYAPDGMCSVDNRFYSIKNGQLYLHNDVDNPIPNTFYGIKVVSKLIMIFNEANGEDKIFKTIVLEGNKPWEAAVNTNFANSTIKSTEFQDKESRYFAYIRKNEDANDFHGNAVQGIGVIQTVSGLNITFKSLSNFISIGDVLYQVSGSVNQVIGTITNITNNTIVVNAITTAPTVGLFSFSKKDSRIEGGEIRGYYLTVELENNDSEKVELFAVNTNAVRSGIILSEN